jgi:hypothetical protein
MIINIQTFYHIIELKKMKINMLHVSRSTPNIIETNKITHMKTCTPFFFGFVLKLYSYGLNIIFQS